MCPKSLGWAFRFGTQVVFWLATAQRPPPEHWPVARKPESADSEQARDKIGTTYTQLAPRSELPSDFPASSIHAIRAHDSPAGVHQATLRLADGKMAEDFGVGSGPPSPGEKSPLRELSKKSHFPVTSSAPGGLRGGQ